MRTIILLVLAGMTALVGGCESSARLIESRNTGVIRAVFSDVWSKGNVGLIDKLYAVEFVGHFPGETFHGRAGIRTHVVSHRRSFPDWTEEIDDIIADGDTVVARFTSRGTNLGDFLGNPPTGNRIEISEVAVFRLKDGRIIEQWVYPDMLSLQQQLRSH